MTRNDLTSLVRYCDNPACGDPIPAARGPTLRSKRRLEFAGFWNVFYAKYVCPECDTARLYRNSFWTGSCDVIAPKAAQRELQRGAVGISVIVLLAWAVFSVVGKRRAAAESEAAQALEQQLAATSVASSPLVEVEPEVAEVYADMELGVLLAVRLRDPTQNKSARFLHVSGYFVDQDGTRYNPRLMRADGSRKPITSPQPVNILPGETYRYYLVAPLNLDPTSDVLPSRKLTRVALYLNGSRPQQVRVGRAR